MQTDLDYAFLANTRTNFSLVFITFDPADKMDAIDMSQQHACYLVSDGKLTIIDDPFGAIAQTEIYEAMMKAVEDCQYQAVEDCELHYICDDVLSDYMNC